MSRRKEIIEAALSCFVKYGVEATTIEMICRAAGASVGSLYHHFGNKEGLAAEVYVAGLRDFQKTMQVALLPVNEIELAIRTLVYGNIDWIVANPMWANYVFHYRQVLSAAELEKSFRSEAMQANIAVWERLKKLDTADQLKEMPVEVFYTMIIAPVHEYAKRWLEKRYKPALQDQREIFADAAWAAVSRRA